MKTIVLLLTLFPLIAQAKFYKLSADDLMGFEELSMVIETEEQVQFFKHYYYDCNQVGRTVNLLRVNKSGESLLLKIACNASHYNYIQNYIFDTINSPNREACVLNKICTRDSVEGQSCESVYGSRVVTKELFVSVDSNNVVTTSSVKYNYSICE